MPFELVPVFWRHLLLGRLSLGTPKMNDEQVRLPVDRRKLKSVLEILDEGARSHGQQFIGVPHGWQGFFAFRHCDRLTDERASIVSRRRNAFTKVELK